jgi:solute carrier family 25 S-adenosylmethionine transporter 26
MVGHSRSFKATTSLSSFGAPDGYPREEQNNVLMLLRPIILLFFLDYSPCHATLDNASSRRHLLIPSSSLATKTTTIVLPPTKRSNTNGSSLHRAISGGVSRAIAQAALYPLDALRTLSQTRDARSLANNNIGLSSLVNGCLQTSTFALLTGACQFGIYGLCSKHYNCSPLVASIYSAAGSCVFSVPQEVIKQRLITGVYTNFRSAIIQIWQTEGVRGYYSGWRPTMSRNVPFVIVTFASRDILQNSGMLRLKTRHRRRRQNNNIDDDSSPLSSTVLEDVSIGIASALIACVITQPMDVVKTRIMTQAASNAIPYTSALDCATSILRNEGWKRLYSGIGQRGLYMGGLWGLTFGFEPILTKYLDERKREANSLNCPSS